MCHQPHPQYGSMDQGQMLLGDNLFQVTYRPHRDNCLSTPDLFIARIFVAYGWAIHGIVFEYHNAWRGGVLLDNEGRPMPLTDANLEAQRGAGVGWQTISSTNTQDRPKRLLQISGHNLRNYRHQPYLCFSLTLQFDAGPQLHCTAQHRDWQGASFAFCCNDISPTTTSTTATAVLTSTRDLEDDIPTATLIEDAFTMSSSYINQLVFMKDKGCVGVEHMNNTTLVTSQIIMSAKNDWEPIRGSTRSNTDATSYSIRSRSPTPNKYCQRHDPNRGGFGAVGGAAALYACNITGDTGTDNYITSSEYNVPGVNTDEYSIDGDTGGHCSGGGYDFGGDTGGDDDGGGYDIAGDNDGGYDIEGDS